MEKEYFGNNKQGPGGRIHDVFKELKSWCERNSVYLERTRRDMR